MVTYENHAFRETIWYFIGVYIINRILHGRLEIRDFSSRVEKYFTRSVRSLVKYLSTLEEKFRISARPCNILYLLYLALGAGALIKGTLLGRYLFTNITFVTQIFQPQKQKTLCFDNQ